MRDYTRYRCRGPSLHIVPHIRRRSAAKYPASTYTLLSVRSPAPGRHSIPVSPDLSSVPQRQVHRPDEFRPSFHPIFPADERIAPKYCSVDSGRSRHSEQNRRCSSSRSDSGAGRVRMAYFSRSSSGACSTISTVAYFPEE